MARELLLSRLAGETWAAVRENGRLAELHVERADDKGRPGGILIGRVTDVVPGIQAAFVDIGDTRAGFLPAAALWLPGESVRSAAGSKRPPIEQRLKAGRELLVQIRRAALPRKGPRLGCHLRLPGRLLVLMPRTPERKISRRIRPTRERERLNAILESLPGNGLGYIARSAADGAEAAAMHEEAAVLLRRWKLVEAEAATNSAPHAIPPFEDGLDRLLRDLPLIRMDRLVIDDEATHRRVLDYATRYVPALVRRIRRYSGEQPLLRHYAVDEEAARLLESRVELDSGGYLVIEQTEALVSIDVNTGRSTARHAGRGTVLQTNLEAAREVAHQIRLRDLGGMIVVDFIDMSVPEESEQVVDQLSQALMADRARTRVFGLAPSGLLQLTRERRGPGPLAALARECPSCAGSGQVADARAGVVRLLGGSVD